MASYMPQRLIKTYLTEKEKGTFNDAAHIVKDMMDALEREKSSIAIIEDNGIHYSYSDLSTVLSSLEHLAGYPVEDE